MVANSSCSVWVFSHEDKTIELIETTKISPGTEIKKANLIRISIASWCDPEIPIGQITGYQYQVWLFRLQKLGFTLENIENLL